MNGRYCKQPIVGFRNGCLPVPHCAEKRMLSARGKQDWLAEPMRQFKAGIFQTLAHSTRIFTVKTLAQGELTVGKLYDAIKVLAEGQSSVPVSEQEDVP
jgi:hypothetical protein